MKINFLQKKPFCIFEIENFLTDDQYKTLYDNFPNISADKLIKSKDLKYSFTSNSDTYQKNKNNECIILLEKIFDESFFLKLLKQVKKEILISRKNKPMNLISLIFRKIKVNNTLKKKNFLEKIFYSCFKYTFEFSYMDKNSCIPPHTDSMAKMISMMMYFPTKEIENQKIGTTFYNSEYKNFQNKGLGLFLKENKFFFKKHFEETITFPYKKKNLYCFIKSDLSWHSVKHLDIPASVTRKSININLNM